MKLEETLLSNLELTISGLRRDLEFYVRANYAKEYIVNQRNSQIQSLIDLRNFFEDNIMTNNYGLYKNIILEIERIEKLDPQLSGHRIELMKSEGLNLSSIKRQIG